MLTVADLPAQALQNLLNSYSIQVKIVANSETIPGSFWGDPEAGLIKNKLYVWPETPVHSALHEACHYICLDSARRVMNWILMLVGIMTKKMLFVIYKFYWQLNFPDVLPIY